MNYFEFATADATLYEGEATQSVNTGLDPILEVRKDMNDSGTVIAVSRALIKFDLSYIKSSVTNGLIPKSAKYYLNLYDAGSSELPSSQTLYGYPVSQSWVQGDGTYGDNPKTTEGVSWRYRDGETSGTQWILSSNDTGGTWFSGSYAGGTRNLTCSASLSYETTDIRMDVTDIVHGWIYSSSAFPNEGFMIKRSGSVGNANSSVDEGSTTAFGQLKFFSRDTSTIYPPKLEAEWNSSAWSTGSLAPLTGSALEDTVVYFTGMRGEYKQNSKIKFKLVGRERYPKKTFSTTSQNLVVKHFPSASVWFSVKDALTEDVIIPFGTGSYISCDSSGHYFNMWMNGLQAERYYKFEIKVQSGSKTDANQIVNYYDDDWTFKVVR